MAESLRQLAEIAFWVCGVAAVLLFAVGIAVSLRALDLYDGVSQSQPGRDAGPNSPRSHGRPLSDGGRG